MKRILAISLGLPALVIGVGVALAANNYRIANPGGVTTTLKSTDNAGVHTPHVNIDSGTVTATLSSQTASTPLATQAAASNSVFKSAAGGLQQLTVTIGATSGWVMVFDATALPSNGATGASMKWCYPVLSNGTVGGIDKTFTPPISMATGITIGFSSTACNSLTASATAFFYGSVQ